MKPRKDLSSAEVEELRAGLEQKLSGVGMDTQPEVAARVVKLVSDPKSGLRDFAAVIKMDAALSGRLLRMANSAFFAQRQPVSNLERACVLLGIERLKALSLGFYLSRAAVGDPRAALSRRIWGEGVYRACLAGEIARRLCPAQAPEAFVAGLMLDSGVPLVERFVGAEATAIIDQRLGPTRHFRAEYETLRLTHVDVAAAMARRWKLPDVLAKPIEWHHSAPGDGGTPGPLQWVHRISYYVGAVELNAEQLPDETTPLPTMASRTLKLSSDDLRAVVQRSRAECTALQEVFRDVADSIRDLDKLGDQVQRQLVEAMDNSMASDIRRETAATPAAVEIGGQVVEVERESEGTVVAYVRDGSGRRLFAHSFRIGSEPASVILAALGLEEATRDEVRNFDGLLGLLAA
ncbi:MAG: HDOD domain-containing protein [Phycisphaerae bacterium]|nr:HDOD domain-containing protein [Phycisphaerae bacterium]